jgi:hypothetical protein
VKFEYYSSYPGSQPKRGPCISLTWEIIADSRVGYFLDFHYRNNRAHTRFNFSEVSSGSHICAVLMHHAVHGETGRKRKGWDVHMFVPGSTTMWYILSSSGPCLIPSGDPSRVPHSAALVNNQ